MRIFSTFILFLLLMSSSAIANNEMIIPGQNCKFPDSGKWIICETDQDCAVTVNACRWLEAINKNYIDQHTKYNACRAPLIECAAVPPDQKPENAAAACVNKKCVLVSPKQ